MGIPLQIEVDSSLYLKNPQEYKLGKRIIEHGIALLDKVGYEAFTFRKLAQQIESTEAGIYRYFASKHHFLLYLLAWYWEWLSYRLMFNMMNVHDPREKLRIAIRTIVDSVRLTTPAAYIDRDLLQRVVIAEGSKAYHTKGVDVERKLGYFVNYTKLVGQIAAIVSENAPNFAFPKVLAVQLLETANTQVFYAEHIPNLTELKATGETAPDALENLLEYMVFGALHGHLHLDTMR